MCVFYLKEQIYDEFFTVEFVEQGLKSLEKVDPRDFIKFALPCNWHIILYSLLLEK
jgi:hypothetical protein